MTAMSTLEVWNYIDESENSKPREQRQAILSLIIASQKWALISNCTIEFGSVNIFKWENSQLKLLSLVHYASITYISLYPILHMNACSLTWIILGFTF